MKPSIGTVARILAVTGLMSAAISVGGSVLTGGAATHFLAVDPPPAAARTIPTTSAPQPRPMAPSVPRLGKVHVVAIGDSVTAGNNCNCTPFLDLYATGLASTYGVRSYAENDGQGGETSSDVLDDLNGDTGEQDDIAAANIVVVTIGANDFGPQYEQIGGGTCGGHDGLECAQAGLTQLRTNLTAIVRKIKALRAGSSTAILLTGYWNVFEDGDVADGSMNRQGRAESDAVTRAVNGIVAQVADDQQTTYVDLYSPFKGDDGLSNPTDLLAGDGDHPNAVGHQLIAKALLRAGTAPLTLG